LHSSTHFLKFSAKSRISSSLGARSTAQPQKRTDKLKTATDKKSAPSQPSQSSKPSADKTKKNDRDLDVDVSSAPDVIVIDRADNAPEETVWEKANTRGEEAAAEDTVWEEPQLTHESIGKSHPW
jgi:hypothetical protein